MTSNSKDNSLNRRDFLKTSAIASGGILFAPTIAHAQSAGIDKDINVALVGCGQQGRVP